MANPVLNEQIIDEARSGWAAPSGRPHSPAGGGNGFPPPASDGPISPWNARVASMGGIVSKTGVLFGILLVAATIGWQLTNPSTSSTMSWVVLLSFPVGLGLLFLLRAKPELVKFIAPIYALVQGVFVGAISKSYDLRYEGIVLQAVGASLAVFAVVLVLYSTRVIKVTQRMQSIVMAATGGLMLFYVASFVLRLFGVHISFLDSPSLLGIGFSLFAAGLAAANLLVTFARIERGVTAGMGRDFEWYGAFALVVDMVWLYVELLRLFGKLARR